MPLTIQLRLSDARRCSNKGMTGYTISRPRMHCQMLSVSQATAAAFRQRMRGPGITLNYKAWDTFFQIVDNSRQIVVPSNKQRLSKVWVLFLNDAAQNDPTLDAFRSCIQGTGVGGVGLGLPRNRLAYPGANHDYARLWDNCPGLLSAQFQVGAELSEAVTTENRSGKVAAEDSPNTGQAFLEQYLRSIGAVNGNREKVEFWGKDLDMRCKDHCGRKLLDTFLCKYFCLCYDGEKLLGDPDIETGVDTQGGKDIVLDLRFDVGMENAAGVHALTQCRRKRIMFLIEYHCQLHVRDNDVTRSF